jgi:hypothetical protein
MAPDRTSKSSRVHIASPGADVVRVVSPLSHFGCERLHLILQRRNAQLYEDVADEVERRAKAWHADVDVRRLHLELFDGPSLLNAISRLIVEEQEAGNEIFVNVATGSNLYTASAMLACLMYGGTPYHSKTREYWSSEDVLRDRLGRPRGITKSAARPEVVPIYGVKPPEPRLVFALELIEHAGGRTKALRLAEGLQAAGLLSTVRGGEAPGEGRRGRESDRHLKVVNRRFVERLLGHRWIEHSGSRAGAQITLTEDGRRVLQSFRGIRYAPEWRKALPD